MKSVVVGLLVVGLMFVGGAAFAADSIDYVPPSSGTVAELTAEFTSGGATNVVVGNAGARMNSQQTSQLLQQFVGEVEVTQVSFSFPATGGITIQWGNDQLLLSRAGVFHHNNHTPVIVPNSEDEGEFVYPGEEAENENQVASINYNLTRDSQYNLGAGDAGEIVSAKGEVRSHSSSSSGGGCSTLTLGALALFLLPAFAFAKKRKV